MTSLLGGLGREGVCTANECRRVLYVARINCEYCIASPARPRSLVSTDNLKNQGRLLSFGAGGQGGLNLPGLTLWLCLRSTGSDCSRIKSATRIPKNVLRLVDSLSGLSSYLLFLAIFRTVLSTMSHHGPDFFEVIGRPHIRAEPSVHRSAVLVPVELSRCWWTMQR